MATSFYNGNFFGGEFFNSGITPPVVEEDAGRPRPDDGGEKRDEKRRRTIYKPTGLIDRPRTVRERLEQTEEIAREIAEEVGSSPSEPPPISEMTLAEVEREIGVLLRKRLRTEEDELILLLLMAASAAG